MLALLSILSVAAIAGCDSEMTVTTYRIPRTPPVEFKAERSRMLVSMVPQDDQVWFFKVRGPLSAIDLIEDTFRQFVEQVQFVDGQPKLDDLPDQWRRGGERMMRYATLDIETPEKQLDVSISKLARLEDYDAMVAMNVNRWRVQMGLEESDDRWADADPIAISAADGPSVWVDLEGDAADAPPMSPPFAGQMPPMGGRSAPPTSLPPGQPSASRSPSASTQPEKEPVTFQAPESWRPSKGSSMRLASFAMGPEDAAAELTVIPAGGDVRGNVARWIGQVRGEPAPDDVVDAALEAGSDLDVDGHESQRFFLTGKDPDQGDAIDATIIPLEDGFSLFVKMTGPVETVRGESEAIAKFLESLTVNL